jgi:DNA-binding beta-propeller fold protein YncE
MQWGFVAMAGAAALGVAPTLVAAQGGAQPPAPSPAVPVPPTQDYLVYVASEGVDKIALVRFGPTGARVDHQIKTGKTPTELSGPHGLAMSPDHKYYYVSTAHGTPFGDLWKYTAGTDSLKGTVQLGYFPATVQVTPDGTYAYVVNFNLYGDMVPSSVSVVYLDDLAEVARITTCTMPHGSRLNPQGTRHYSACMMDDLLVEIDTKNMNVSRHFQLTKGSEKGMDGAPNVRRAAAAGTAPAMSHDMSGHGMEGPKPGDVSCSPTWAQPSADGTKIFVACNKSSDLVEVDAATWTMTRRIPAGNGVYNLAVTRNGKLVVGTNKRGQSVSVIDIASGKELARIATKRRIPSGLVISPDDRYAFVTLEGVGSEPGTVEVIDLAALKSVATVDVGQQAGGIDFWKMESAANK